MLNGADIASNISADLYISGNFTAGRGDPPIVVINPYDNRQITALLLASADQVDEAVEAAQYAFRRRRGRVSARHGEFRLSFREDGRQGDSRTSAGPQGDLHRRRRRRLRDPAASGADGYAEALKPGPQVGAHTYR
jgi:hypothetical protein